MTQPTDTALMQAGKPGDDPTVAPGPLLRPLPARPLGVAAWSGLLLMLLGLLAWEWHWRAFGASPGYRNSDGQWAEQRRRIDGDDGDATVLLGASRVLFDIDLDTWERVAGERPIQLAVEGTTPLPMLEDLADDPDFSGRVLVGVAPDVFFSGFAYRGEIRDYYQDQTPSQRFADWLSMSVLEPRVAYYGDADFAFFTVLERQPWPPRTGMPNFIEVRKLSMSERDRNTRMWWKVERDAEYRALCRQVWAQYFDVPLPGFDTPEKRQAGADEQIGRAAAAIAKLRARHRGGVRTAAERRRLSGVRAARLSTRQHLGCVARTHRRPGHPFRGSPGATGAGAAGVVASVAPRRATIHRGAAGDTGA